MWHNHEVFKLTHILNFTWQTHLIHHSIRFGWGRKSDSSLGRQARDPSLVRDGTPEWQLNLILITAGCGEFQKQVSQINWVSISLIRSGSQTKELRENSRGSARRSGFSLQVGYHILSLGAPRMLFPYISSLLRELEFRKSGPEHSGRNFDLEWWPSCRTHT